jgi:hypothetical protein
MTNKWDVEFLSTIEPFHVDTERWWVERPVEYLSDLKPDGQNDIMLIVGDGRDVLKDMIDFVRFEQPFDLMCINFSPKIMPKNLDIHHYIAGDSHTKEMQKIAESLPCNTIRHCWNRNSKHFDVRWARNTSKSWTGTTANLGIKIGIALGYLKIVLAGCPMDESGNWYTKSLPENDVKKHKNHTAHLWKWTEIGSRPIGRFIRSMSGNTARIFGKPDAEWLQDV